MIQIGNGQRVLKYANTLSQLKVLYIFFINFVVWVDHDLPYVTLESEWWSLLYPNLLTIFALLLESSSLAACSSVTIHSRQENFNHVCI